ncbi:terminase gpP N-terminus-related DNA-binding protein [Actinocrispum wychmicini]|uniref:terminase gpP N-terminus-related DNA-binding protein n=1 Tax=Actinocrispum wychmicini TaxID=1213861 RepID=UPI001FB5DBCB|nr:helix-turn-helix domain-containing protein [Actinocrispum wychmicini]
MLSLEEDVQAHALRQQGWSISAIARHLGIDRKTVRAYLSGERKPGRPRRTQPTLIEPFLLGQLSQRQVECLDVIPFVPRRGVSRT